MIDDLIRVSAHANLDFNSPMSDARADELIRSLRPLDGARVLDLGCGWGELLLRLLDAAPTATGTGVELNPHGVERGRIAAERRGLEKRARLVRGDATAYRDEQPADVVIAIGVTHLWGGYRETLEAARDHLAPGGRLLIGEGFWERSPTPEALRALEDAAPDEFGTLGEMVDLAVVCGYRPLDIAPATPQEWDAFESRWCGGIERWLLANPHSPHAEEMHVLADEHRNGWLHGYRGILGFAYLTLGVPHPQTRPERT